MPGQCGPRERGRSQIKYIPVTSSFLFWTVSLFQVQRAAIPKFIWGTVVTCSFWCWAEVCLWADGWRLCKPLAGVTRAEGLEGGSLCSSLFEKYRSSCVSDILQSFQQRARVNIFIAFLKSLLSCTKIPSVRSSIILSALWSLANRSRLLHDFP